jgi:hypothetical protein
MNGMIATALALLATHALAVGPPADAPAPDEGPAVVSPKQASPPPRNAVVDLRARTRDLLKHLQNYQAAWERAPDDPVVYQRYAALLRRALAKFREELPSEPGVVSPARTAVEPKSTTSSKDRPKDPKTAAQKQAEATARTHLRPNPEMMKQRAREAESRQALLRLVAEAEQTLKQLDAATTAGEPDRPRIRELFGQLRSQLERLDRLAAKLAPAPTR